LVAAGHDVTALARSDAKAAQVTAAGASPVRVDLFDTEAIAASVRGHDAVVNLATNIPTLAQALHRSAWETNDRIRSEGSSILVDAALAAGAERYVQESITFVYPDRGDAWIDEEVPIEPAPGVESVLAAEASARRFADGGGTGVVLRFSAFYAPEASHTQMMLHAAPKGVGLAAGAPSAYFSSIHADDAAASVVAALGISGGTYNVSDDLPVTRKELVRTLARAVGRRRIVLTPGRLAAVIGKRSQTMTRSWRVSNRKLKDASDWTPRYPSVHEGMPVVAAAAVALMAAEPEEARR
jgi:nucleoside-diphosphate-sugar epimerase